MLGVIYKFTILTIGKFYVGQHWGEIKNYWGSGSIWNDYLSSLKKKFPHCWQKLLKCEILYQGECNQKTLDKLEEIYIRREHSHYSEERGGCNVLRGTANEFGSGSPSKDELVKNKISKSRKGKCVGNEHFLFGKHWDEETKKKNSLSNKGKQAGERHWHFGQHWNDEVKKKIGDKNRGKQPWLGKHHTEDTKRRLSQHFLGKKWSDLSKQKMSNRVTGNGNPMYGKIRITNGKENKIIDSNTPIPDGWVRGMKRNVKR